MDAPLTADELRGLELIATACVSADYWDDETIQRYREYSLVACDGVRIHLTDEGRAVLAAARATDDPIAS